MVVNPLPESASTRMGADRDREPDRCAFPRAALGDDLSPMSFDQILGDGQAQSAAGGVMGLVEPVKDVRQVFRANSLPRVHDGEEYPPPRFIKLLPETDLPSLRRVTQRVGNQVGQDLAHARGLCP